jgi:hypothetical protein
MQKNGAMEADFEAGIERPFGQRAARQTADLRAQLGCEATVDFLPAASSVR